MGTDHWLPTAGTDHGRRYWAAAAKVHSSPNIFFPVGVFLREQRDSDTTEREGRLTGGIAREALSTGGTTARENTGENLRPEISSILNEYYIEVN